MLTIPKKIIQKSANILGYKIIKMPDVDSIVDGDEKFLRIYNKCEKYTMTRKDRMYALYKAVEYIITAKIKGDFVECGVWKGGSMMLVAYTLLELNAANRKIYLYDTFTGMTEPTEDDYFISSKEPAHILWAKGQKKNYNDWVIARLSEVKKNMFLTGYPNKSIIFVKGKVEETIPKVTPSQIGILRLDTDFYTSTKHELKHLFPLLVKGGVLIVDDYGSFAGSKKAVDEYFINKPILLNRVDSEARIGVKI
jgi:hypothetical protein